MTTPDSEQNCEADVPEIADTSAKISIVKPNTDWYDVSGHLTNYFEW